MPRNCRAATFTMSSFLHVIYTILNASVILERNKTRLVRNDKCLARNETHLARNETRGSNVPLSSTVHLDELSLVVHCSRRILKDSLSRRIMRLVPIFILKTHN